MAEQYGNNAKENKGSGLAVQDDISSPTDVLGENEHEHVLEAEVVQETSFSERWKTHNFLLVRGSYFVLRSVWMVAMFIGGLIAWIISLLFI